MKNSLKIIVSTSNRYEHLIPIFCYLFNKNLGSDYSAEIVGYIKPDFELPSNFTFHSLGEQVGGAKNFTTDLRKYFEQQDDLFFWCMEDCWIREVNITHFNILSALASRTPEVGKISLNEAAKLQDHFEKEKIGHLTILENTQTALYRLACQPSIWRKQFLLQYMTPDMTPWEFETQKSINDGWRILGPYDPVVMSNEGVTKWDLFDYNFYKIPQEQIDEMRSLGYLDKQTKK